MNDYIDLGDDSLSPDEWREAREYGQRCIALAMAKRGEIETRQDALDAQLAMIEASLAMQ